jgi:glucoamylase
MGDAAPAPSGFVAQSWTSGAKDAVVAALSTRVWATVGRGIVNEVYWPAVDQPQVKDFGFLVVGPPGWREVKRATTYAVTLDDPAVPVPSVVHTGEFFRLELRFVPDPERDALLVRYVLTGTANVATADLRLYPLLAPHLGRSTVTPEDQWPQLGMDNYAVVDGENLLHARDAVGAHFLCLAAQPAFARASAGYVGTSDGWTDMFQHGGMTATYRSAGPGAVALMGELVPDGGTFAGVLALGFGSTAESAGSAATLAAAADVDAVATAVTAQWVNWHRGLRLPDGPGVSTEAQASLRQSATVLHCNEDRDRPGGVVAGLAVPWGDVTNDPGGYHMVWCRDSCESAFALAALGDTDTGVRLLSYLAAIRSPEFPDDPSSPACWLRCYFLDGTPMPGDVQLDEVGFPVLLAAKLRDLGVALPSDVEDAVRSAAAYVARHGPASGIDRWEETPGASPFTLAVEIAALVAASELFGEPERNYLLALADNWDDRLEQFTYVVGGELDEAFGTAGHYVRIGGPTSRIQVGNQPANTDPVGAELMVGLDFLYLTRLGLRSPSDQRITDSVTVADQMIRVQPASGTTYYRYDLDGYGEWLDGSGWPLRKFGIGRPWPLLAGERGHYEALCGRDATPWLDAMLGMRGPGGLLPEQVWDRDPLPWRHLYPGKPTGSAMPLAWAHSELIKLAVAMADGGRPVERLRAVEQHYPNYAVPATTVWSWRDNAPVELLPTGCDLVVEQSSPFTLHYGFDGWNPGSITERRAEPRPFGMFGVTLTAADLDGHRSLQFVRRWADSSWDGVDHAVALGASRATFLRLPSEQHAAAAAGRTPR